MLKQLKKFVLPLLFGAATFAQGTTFFPAAEAQKLVSQGALLLDVRTPEEFKEGHAEGAKNIPVGELDQRLAEVGDKKRTVIVYCRSGRRSETAKAILIKAGWKRVENIGGLDAWPKS